MTPSLLPAAIQPPATPFAAIAILLIDDQPAVREGLARLITGAAMAPRGVHTAGTPAEALDAARRLQPELVVLDVDLAGEDGLALMPQLPARSRVLVLTSHGDAATRQRALRLGAGAFVEKQQPACVLLASLAALIALGQPGPSGDAP